MLSDATGLKPRDRLLLLDCVADFSQMPAESVVRIGSAFREVTVEVQPLSQGAPGGDRFGPTTFALPNLARGRKQFCDILPGHETDRLDTPFGKGGSISLSFRCITFL